MIRRALPDIEDRNNKGACWTCFDKAIICDGSLPRCKICIRQKQKCGGYGVRLQRAESIQKIRLDDACRPKKCTSTRAVQKTSVPLSLSPFALLPSESRLLQHFIQHISSLALAVDYTENGYRMLTPMAIEEPALMNAMLAVAAAHISKWQHIEDMESRKYLRKALLRLQDILDDPDIAVKESTLGAILCLISYEVFNGTGRWRQHFGGVVGWIKLKGDCSSLNSFLKTWICMIDTQAAMNLGQNTMPEVEQWLNSGDYHEDGHPVIDPLFGCSTQLPKLMLQAARLYNFSRTLDVDRPDSMETEAELRHQAELLRMKIIAAAVDIQSEPSLAVSCDNTSLTATAAKNRNRSDAVRRMNATAEIFRHALLVYVFRVINGPHLPLDEATQHSVDETYRLLPYVPDAFGPGANLGWAFVVIGSETDSPDLRQYIRCRWRGLTLLEMNNNKSGERLTEEVWRRRDSSNIGTRVAWQDVMRDLGGEQILV